MTHDAYRRRLKDVSFDKLENLREKLKLNYKEIAQLLNVSQHQIYCYKKRYTLPASRYYALRDALLINVEREANEQRKMIYDAMSLEE